MAWGYLLAYVLWLLPPLSLYAGLRLSRAPEGMALVLPLVLGCLGVLLLSLLLLEVMPHGATVALGWLSPLASLLFLLAGALTRWQLSRRIP